MCVGVAAVLRALRYIHRKLLIESVFLLMGSSVVAMIDDDPTSDKALEQEQVFLDEIERNAFAEHKDLSDTSTRPTVPTVNLENNPPKEKAIYSDNIAKLEEIQKNVQPLKKSISKHYATPKRPKAQKTKKIKYKEAFAGCYGGILGGTSHRYAETSLWTITHRPIMPKSNSEFGDSFTKSEISTIYYGSYSYNNNSYLINGALFLGYDFRMTKLFRVGIEFRGEMEWRTMEICSNGAHGKRANNMRKDGTLLPETFTYEGKLCTGVNFAYVRQTMQMPYNFSFIPRIGVTVSENSLIYTKLGVIYGPVEIVDHPETIKPSITETSKKEQDMIYKNARPSVIGGIGFETAVTKQLFLRMECLYSQGPGIKLDKEYLIDEKNSANKNRQLKNFNIKSIKNFSIGLGAGVRF